jgi:signal transduction histidine kinase
MRALRQHCHSLHTDVLPVCIDGKDARTKPEMASKQMNAGIWQGLTDWMKRLSAQPGVDKHNSLMLLTTLVIVGAGSLAMALLPASVVGPIEPGETWVAPAIFSYVSASLIVLANGMYPLSAGMTVAGGLILIGGSYYTYGLQVQPGLLIIHMIPLLLSALLLGRTAVWWTALGSIVGLAIGAWADMRNAPGQAGTSEAISSLSLGSMNYLILAVILDRLILSSKRTLEQNRELNKICGQLEREIHEKELAHSRLLHTQRMEAIGRLSTGVAHDFGNILSVIVGLVTSAEMQARSADAVLPGIHRAAQRGTVLVRRLLSFSRTQSRQASIFDLAGTLDDLRALMSPIFHKRIQLRIEPAPPGLLVEADRDELELALLNIASNASDAMPRGGCFTLSVEVSEGHALIRMSDTGIGMSSNVRARVFEPFFTTKPKGEGTGIGMAIVHRFVSDSGGDIDVDSSPGKGTRIRLRLPLVTHFHGGRSHSAIRHNASDEPLFIHAK